MPTIADKFTTSDKGADDGRQTKVAFVRELSRCGGWGKASDPMRSLQQKEDPAWLAYMQLIYGARLQVFAQTLQLPLVILPRASQSATPESSSAQPLCRVLDAVAP